MPAVRIQQSEGPLASGKRLKHFHQRAIDQLALDDEAIGLEQDRATLGQGHAAEHVVGTEVVAQHGQNE